MMLYWIGKSISRVIMRIFGRWQVIGRENIPKTGGVLLCGNHVSYIDPPALGAAATRQVHFMAKLELFQVPVMGPLIKRVGAFPVRQRQADRAALKQAIEYLEKGEVVGMFPEGGRMLDGQLGEVLPGAGMIVLRAKVPVVPVALINTDKLLPPHSIFLKFTHVKVVFGKPIPMDDLYELGGREAVEEVGKRLMNAIGEMIQQYRQNNV